MSVDLHVHTTASDGIYSPVQVVKMAVSLGLSAIAITDHDTTEGIKFAKLVAQGLPLEIIPGIEINTEHQGQEIHILGYYYSITDQEFLALLSSLIQARRHRVGKIVARLQQLGYRITLTDVWRVVDGAVPGRPHVADTLVELGLAENRREVFQELLGKNCPGYVPRPKFPPTNAIRHIQQAGGVAVWAHPGMTKADYLLPELIAAGLDGIEVFHPEHSEGQAQHYQDIAEKYQLVQTGGSDFHGYDYEDCLGKPVVPDTILTSLKTRAGQL